MQPTGAEPGRLRPANVVVAVVGALLALIGLAIAAGGATLVWAHATQRDAAGFYTTRTETLSTPGYALTADADFGSRNRPVGTVLIRATAPAGRAVFVGVAPRDQVDAWLAGVPHEQVTSMTFGPFHTHTEEVHGDQAAGRPGAQGFWSASSTGAGTQTVLWPSESGRWSTVVMNADAAAGVTAGVQVGADTGVLLPIGLGVGAFGLLLAGGGVVMLVLGLRGSQQGKAPAWVTAPAGAGAPGAYPARLEGRLDPAVGRWLWLVKWLLVVPHLVVLAFLWVAAWVLTVVAGLAILVTGRYPRSIFEFNVGVFRWSWRVFFYAIGAFGTDRYPPFSLAPDPTYPADLSIDPPERLSRGLVLVKWWLLALPQYLIVGIFAGGWEMGLGGRWRGAGGGLIAILTVIAGVILAVSGRYPGSIFDFVMGMDRWCFRVLAYAALMRDEYPPFRLDPGGTDPGSPPGPFPPAPRSPGAPIGVS